MANSLIPSDQEKVLQFACYAGNKLSRIGLMTSALLAAATGVDDLLSDLYAGLVVSGTSNSKYPPEVKIALRYFEQGVKLLHLLGKLTDVQVAALTDWSAASADTSLRYLFSQWVTLNGFDPTAEPFLDGVFSQGISA